MSETTVNMTPPPPPQPPAEPPPLRRSSSDRVLGGVCGGLGRYWNVDPVILRVVFGVSLLLGGVGLFAYLAFWWLVPDDSLPGPARITPSWGLRLIGAGSAFIAVMIGLGLLFGDSLGNGGVLLGALLAGVVIWIVMSQKAARPAAPEVVAAPPQHGYAYGGAGDYSQTTVLPPPPGPPAPPRHTSYLGLIGLCAAVAVGGLAIMLGLSYTAILAAPLLVLALTMLVGAFLGRAKWLLVFAIPLLMLLGAVAQIQQLDLRGPIGEMTWRPQVSGDTYNMTAGALTVDFSDWRGPGQPSATDSVSVYAGVGQVDILAPRNWDIRLVAGQTAVTVFKDGRPVPTRQIDRKGTALLIPATAPRSDGTITVEVSLRGGEVRVLTGSPAVGRGDSPKDSTGDSVKKKTNTTKSAKEQAA